MSSLKELLAAKQQELASAQESVRDWEERDMEHGSRSAPCRIRPAPERACSRSA